MKYPEKQFGDVRVLCYKREPTSVWKICIPTQQLDELTNWFHLALNHCGLHRLLTTINMHLYHPRLRRVSEQSTQNCDACQRQKQPGTQDAHLPPREAALIPWEEVALDLIGPWKVTVENESYEFYALTCIDPVTNYPDAIPLRNKTASHVGMQFENMWLSRYPRPLRCLHDRGTEFIGADFQ